MRQPPRPQPRGRSASRTPNMLSPPEQAPPPTRQGHLAPVTRPCRGGHVSRQQQMETGSYCPFWHEVYGEAKWLRCADTQCWFLQSTGTVLSHRGFGHCSNWERAPYAPRTPREAGRAGAPGRAAGFSCMETTAQGSPRGRAPNGGTRSRDGAACCQGHVTHGGLQDAVPRQGPMRGREVAQSVAEGTDLLPPAILQR